MNSIQDMILVLAAAGFMGVIIGLVYNFAHSRAVYASKMTGALVVYAILAAMLLFMRVSVSAASVIGAAVIIRFRTPVKDHRDLLYILWAVISGFCCATHMFVLLGAGSVVMILALVITKAVKNYDRVLIAVKGNGKDEEGIIEHISHIAGEKDLIMIANNSVEDSYTELIYEVKEREGSFSIAEKLKDKIYESVPEITEVTVVYQEDDMSI